MIVVAVLMMTMSDSAPFWYQLAFLARWNSTEVYSRVAGKWRIIHSHWSYTKPDIKQPGP